MPSSPSQRTHRPILVVGANGQVGAALVPALAHLGPIEALGRAALDLSNEDAIRQIIRALSPLAIINAAAYTAVDRAEDEPVLAHAVNAIAPRVMAQEAAACGACFIHYSTDYVFDGAATKPYKESDEPHPINVYGCSKLAGEQAVISADETAIVLRTCWVYSTRGSNFLLTMRRLANEREELKVVQDQRGNPTSAQFLARSTAALLERTGLDRVAQAEHAGVFHLSSEGEGSWFDFATAILAQTNPTVRIRPISSEEFPTKARRPAYSVLDKTKIREHFGLHIPDWRTQLAEVLVGLRNP